MHSWATGAGTEIIQLLSGRSNAYLVRRGDAFLMVDTGRSGSRRRLVRNLEKCGLKAGSNFSLLLTHTHFDHVENAAFLQREFGARVLVHESEAEYLTTGDSPLPAGTIMVTRILMDLFAARLQSFFRFEALTPAERINRPRTVNDFGISLEILPIPGHTRGSLGLIVDKEIVLVGDAMFGIWPRSILSPFGDDLQGMKEGWSHLLETGCSLFLPGHGRAIRKERVARAAGSKMRGTR